MPRVYLSRRATFSASHRLASEYLSEAENERIFGKCFHPNGHGHNYELEVILAGEVQKESGILFNLADLKKVIEEVVMAKVDHKHLNMDVPEFKNLNPTTENLAIVIWKWLEAALPRGLLYELRVRETENNLVIYRGE